MSQFELEIIERLSNKAAEPSGEFSKSLHKHLLERELVLKKANLTPVRRRIMGIKKISLGIAILAVIAGIALTLQIKNDDIKPQEVAQTPNSSTTQTSALPNQQVQNLQEAKKSLTFTPLLPSKQLNGETLANIKIGTKNNMLDDSDTIYLTYTDNQGTLFKMSQSSKALNYPTDTEKVSLQLGERQITANYYKLAEEETGGENSVGGDVSAPTSYIFWSANDVNYEISEFGRVTKQQLIDLANSLQ